MLNISTAFGQLPGQSAPPFTPDRTASLVQAEGPVSEAQAINSKLAEARASLAAELAGDAAQTNVPPGIPVHDVALRRALLERLVRLLEQQISNDAELEAARRRRTETARQAQAWTKFAESPPYSVLLSDRLRQEIQGEKSKRVSNQAAVQAISQLIAANRATLNETQERIRQLNEQLEGTKDPAAAARFSWNRELERLRSRVAAATLGLLDAENQARAEALDESRIRLGWLQRQLAIASSDTKFAQTDLEAIKDRLQADAHQLDSELAEAEGRARTALAALAAAREQSGRIQTTPDADSGATALATELVAVRETQWEAAQAAIRILRLMLECGNVERTMWEMRFDAENSRTAQTLRESRRRLRTFAGRLDVWKAFQDQQSELFSAQIELQEARIRDLPADSDLLPLAKDRLAALHERDQLLLRLLRRISQAQRLNQRWEEGLRSAEERLPFFGRVQTLFSDARSFLGRLWRFELLTAEDTITVEGQKITGKRSVTLGKVVLAVLILAAGIYFIRLVSRIVRPILIRRFKMEPPQASLLLKWLKALLIACFVLFSMTSVKIPLTVFAFAGGALAIGLGFGMQTLLKNFVSGLILLFERPFRVGDVLEVGGQRGMITEIGLRASVLQLWDGTETLIPNSSLLETNVTNWTYSNPKVRFSLAVGAAYGSDTRRVIQLLAEVAERHGLVQKDPKPQVLFTDFGDSALTFELRFWVDVVSANAAQVGSDLRQMIAGAFAENGIVIAFPQRDLHLDTTRPLAVEIITPRAPLQTLAKEETSNHQLPREPAFSI